MTWSKDICRRSDRKRDEIGFHDLQPAGLFRVSPGKRRVVGLPLDAGHATVPKRVRKAERRDAHAAAKFQNASPAAPGRPRPEGPDPSRRDILVSVARYAGARPGTRRVSGRRRSLGNREFVVAQHGSGAERIGAAHEQTARQNTYGSFQGAHMDVHLEHLYILAGQERRCEGDDGGIVAAQDL
jgi:hypothetical protein